MNFFSVDSQIALQRDDDGNMLKEDFNDEKQRMMPGNIAKWLHELHERKGRRKFCVFFRSGASFITATLSVVKSLCKRLNPECIVELLRAGVMSLQIEWNGEVTDVWTRIARQFLSCVYLD